MRINVKVDQTSTASELIILGALFESLALAREGHVVSVPAEECNGDDPTPVETVVVQVPPAAAGEEAPKRHRRTKAEIKAANATTYPEPPPEPVGAEQGTIPAPTEPEQEPATETPAHTPDVQPPVTPPSETASTEPASVSPSEGGKTYTHAEVQALAVDTARRYGPEKVKALIATYPNAAKIAELDEGDLAGFVAKLQAITA